MQINETNQTMSVEKSALICWYYQCKKYTPIRISVITHVDIQEVKRVLRKNCVEYASEEKREKDYYLWNLKLNNVYGMARC